MSRGRPKERDDVAPTKYIRCYGDWEYHFDVNKNPNGFWKCENVGITYNKLETLYIKLEKLKEPKYQENGRKKRITKDDKQNMEKLEEKYWKEYYKTYPKDIPKKKK